MIALPALGAKLLWKVGAGFAVVATLVLGFFLIKAQIEHKQLVNDKAALTKSINDPVTGYIARLTTANNNVIILKAAVAKQNSEFTRQSNEGKAQMDRLRGQLKIAQAERAVLQRRVEQMLGKPIDGKTPAERLKSVDDMVLEDLKK